MGRSERTTNELVTGPEVAINVGYEFYELHVFGIKSKSALDVIIKLIRPLGTP